MHLDVIRSRLRFAACVGWLILVPAAVAETRLDKTTYRIPMADGVRLATDVYLPEAGGRFPVILMRTPYNKERPTPPSEALRGYAVVIQDMRGRFASEGENLPFIGCGWKDHRDGAETVAWIGQQSWCSGRIATLGASACGITQNLMAGCRPKGLVGQHITVAAADLYRQATYVGGALRQSQVEKWITENHFDPKALQLMRDHPDYDSYWQGFDATTKVERMNVPAVHVGGWFDTFCKGTVDAFVSRQTLGDEGSRGCQKLVMGPWGHGVGRPVGELHFPNLRPPADYSAARFFDWILKGQDNGFAQLSAVTYYVMGDVDDPKAPGNEWRRADSWPIPAAPTAWYLQPDGVLEPGQPAQADRPRFREYRFDPREPCPTVGGCNLVLKKGPMDQRRIETRDDVLVFSSAPLVEPMEVTGQAGARLYVASSAVDTDLSIRLCDVYPDGRSFLMAEGMLRLRKRVAMAENHLLVPNAICEVRVDCWPTSIVFNRGHRVRLTVTSSNHPRFDVNPGTGKPWRPGCEMVVQRNRVYTDAAHPSQLVLPVVGGRPRTD